MKSCLLFFRSVVAIFSLAVVFAVIPATAAVEHYEVAPGSAATFEAIGKPSIMKIQGKGASVEGTAEVSDQSVKGTFQLSLDQFTTGIESRDKHMKEKYLETTRYPKATLIIESVFLPKNWSPGTELKDASFRGQLTLKDATKPLEGKVSVGTGDMATKADFVIKLSDYPALGVPSYAGITVADAVTVHIEIPKFKKLQ